MTLRVLVLASSITLSLIVALVSVTLISPTQVEAAPSYEVRSCGGGTIKLKFGEKRMLAMHNRVRTNKGAPRLCINPKLQRAARKHARDMILRDYFSHRTKGSGDTYLDRIREEGYRPRASAENIAYGSRRQGYPRNIFQGWRTSPGHNRNMFNPEYRQVGIGMVGGNFQGTRATRIWVADFGTPR